MKNLLVVFGLTSTIIETQDVKTLKESAKTLGVTAKGLKKEELIAALSEAIVDANKAAKTVVKDKKISKSEKMRQIYALGINSPRAIANLMGTHYSYTYGVITRMRAAIEAAANAPEETEANGAEAGEEAPIAPEEAVAKS